MQWNWNLQFEGPLVAHVLDTRREAAGICCSDNRAPGLLELALQRLTTNSSGCSRNTRLDCYCLLCLWRKAPKAESHGRFLQLHSCTHTPAPCGSGWSPTAHNRHCMLRPHGVTPGEGRTREGVCSS